MTDSEGDSVGRREAEQILLKLLDSGDADAGVPLETVLKALVVPGGARDDATAMRFLRSLGSIEVTRDQAEKLTRVKRSVGQFPQRRIPERHKKRDRGATTRPQLAGFEHGAAFNEHGRVGYICVADEFQLPELARHYQAEGYHTNLAFDVLHITPKGVAGEPAYAAAGSSNAPGHFDMFLFDYGVVVWWSAHPRMFRIVETDFAARSSRLQKFFVNRCKESILEENFPVWCNYSSDTRTDVDPTGVLQPDSLFLERLRFDHFLIRNNSADIKLCISHALGQSAKIDYLEHEVEALTWQCKPLPRELKDKGAVTISERDLLQLRGEVLFFRLMLKSGSDLLDEPELFWQHPWLKPFYTVTKEAFQVTERVSTLDAKLDTANEILSMISDQFNQRHGSRLEWIVIWLVMVEVVIGVLELMVDVKPWIIGNIGASPTTYVNDAERPLLAHRRP